MRGIRQKNIEIGQIFRGKRGKIAAFPERIEDNPVFKPQTPPQQGEMMRGKAVAQNFFGVKIACYKRAKGGGNNLVRRIFHLQPPLKFDF